MKKILLLSVLALLAYLSSQFLLLQNRKILKDKTVTWITL